MSNKSMKFFQALLGLFWRLLHSKEGLRYRYYHQYQRHHHQYYITDDIKV